MPQANLIFFFVSPNIISFHQPMHVFYADSYVLPLPPDHRFPIQKYRLLREDLLRQSVLCPDELHVPPPATLDMIKLAHSADYVHSIYDGTIERLAMRKIGFPWSSELVIRSFAIVGGAIASAECALRDGIAGNLAGGTHHAMRDSGEGFCVFNDLAIVALKFLREGIVKRVAIVDLDVHHGNGNAAILAERSGTGSGTDSGVSSDVYVLSLHGAKNYPFHKPASTEDIALADGTEDDEYLALLKPALERVVAFKPDIVLYQAGVDVLQEDALGRLSLSLAGIGERDRLVFEAFAGRGIPVSLALGGGYAKPIERTVEAHVQTYRVLKSVYGV
jgi:acetoin utilization deacetylase AcuC-like enzyme